MAEKTENGNLPATASSNREETRGSECQIAPPVDIYETAEGLTVVADLPGVAKDDVNINVDNRTLTIEGRPKHISPGESIQNEFSLVKFHRQFELGERVDQERISAEMKNGVLTLQLPKLEEAKPRRIEVSIA